MNLDELAKSRKSPFFVTPSTKNNRVENEMNFTKIRNFRIKEYFRLPDDIYSNLGFCLQ
jgi:hypothetical protein